MEPNEARFTQHVYFLRVQVGQNAHLIRGIYHAPIIPFHIPQKKKLPAISYPPLASHTLSSFANPSKKPAENFAHRRMHIFSSFSRRGTKFCAGGPHQIHRQKMCVFFRGFRQKIGFPQRFTLVVREPFSPSPPVCTLSLRWRAKLFSLARPTSCKF